MPLPEPVARAFIAALNHVLGQQSWARARLAAHAGAHLALSAPPLLPALAMAITATGQVEVAAQDREPALRISVKPAAIPGLLARNRDALKQVELAGNADLAATVQDLVLGLEWDLEEDLARLVGDIAAHRIAGAGRDFLAWQVQALERTAQNIAEYLTEENPLLARRAEFDLLRRELDVLALETERTQLRVGTLAARVAASTTRRIEPR